MEWLHNLSIVTEAMIEACKISIDAAFKQISLPS